MRYRNLISLLLITLFIGYAIAQSVEPLGDADIVGIFQKLPEGILPLQFNPQTFQVGLLREGQFQDYILDVTNPNPFGLNITWTGPQINASIPIQLRLQLNTVTFTPNTFIPIDAGQTLIFVARVRANTCQACPVGEVPFKASFLFSGINGSIPSPTINPGTDGSMLIINAEARAENFTVFWNATFQNESGEAQTFDVTVRLQRGGAIEDFTAMRISVPTITSETIQGKLDLPPNTINGTVWQVQIETLTLPDAGGRSFALLIIPDVHVIDGIIPPVQQAGEPPEIQAQIEIELERQLEIELESQPFTRMISQPLFAPVFWAIVIVGIIVSIIIISRKKR